MDSETAECSYYFFKLPIKCHKQQPKEVEVLASGEPDLAAGMGRAEQSYVLSRKHKRQEQKYSCHFSSTAKYTRFKKI